MPLKVIQGFPMIPNYQMIMLPLLRFVANYDSIRIADAVRHIIEYFRLTDEEQHESLANQRQSVIYNRVGWARTYLIKAGLLASKQRGMMEITERGNAVLSQKLSGIDVQYLRQFSEFQHFWRPLQPKTSSVKSVEPVDKTPDEILEDTYLTMKTCVLEELLEKIHCCTPEFFEKLVVDAIVGMGYGGSYKDASHAIGRSGDEGIDGIINEDRLGLDVIYLQAKRWVGKIGRPEIQKFAGALQGKRAKKGIFITTSDFTAEAYDYVKNLETKIVLISGGQLTDLMWEHGVGVQHVRTFELKKVDGEYFDEYME